MRRVVCMLLGIAMATGLLVGLSATSALAPEAAAVDYVSRKFTDPKKGQTGNHIVALQRRLRKAGVLEKADVTGYNGCSHGCVNIRARSTIAWIFDQIRVGDRVYIYWS